MISAACAIWLSWAIPAFNAISYGQPSAALWKDQLFTAITSHSAPGLLYRGPFTPTIKRIRSPVEYVNEPVWFGVSPQAKLHIRYDRVLLCCGSAGYYIFPFSELPLFENNTFGKKLSELREGPEQEENPLLQNDPDRRRALEFARYTSLIFPYEALYSYLLFPKHRQPDVPITDNDRDDGDTSSAATYWRTARYDVLIAGEKTVWLFHAYKDKLFVSLEWNYLAGWYLDPKGEGVAKNLPKRPERQLRTGKLPTDFTEPFAVYAAGARGFLVTPNGKVYMAVSKGKAEVEVTKVWDDPKRRIVGVVQDQANDAVYGWGFVTDSAAPERFYVKFAPKPVAVEYKRTVPLWNDRSDAYLESYECARASRKAGKK